MRNRKVRIVAFAVATSLAGQAAFVQVDIRKEKPVATAVESVVGKAKSLLPPGKEWKLVWHDEFDQKEIDKTKWMCRESFWGQDFPAFAHNFEGVEMTGETVKLNLFCKDGQFSSPHLQTGSLTYDVPKDTKGLWPFGAYRKPLFMHRYGYYEIRCRQPKHPGWHSAFWLQAPGVGSSSDPSVAGVETDIMENYRQFVDGKIVGGNGWNGYGKDSCWFGHFSWDYEEYEDGWCYYGVDWSPKGYTFYANGKKVGEQNDPVSHVPQFILVSTEPRGYRNPGSDGGLTAGQLTWGKPDPRLFDVPLPDTFEVDFVRVYDAVEPVDVSVKEMLDGFIDTGKLTGVVSVLSDADYNVQVECAGWADVEKRVPVTERSMFAIFSMTKSFTGTALMCAIDEGKISLDDPVSKYLPEFADVKMKDGTRPKRPLTVRDLACHQTGFRWSYHCVDSALPLREVARQLASHPLEFQPGETFSYGNAWIDSAAACLEVAVGEPYEKYLQRKVLDPLGMKDTTFWPNEEQVSRLVKAYTSDEYALRPGKDVCTPQLVFPKKTRIYPAASGGLFSTPADMIRFSQMLAHHGTWKDRTIVSRKTFDALIAVKQTESGINEPYTVGAWIWGDWLGHEGAMRTDQRANLKTGHSRVFFINTENAAGPAFFQLKAVWQFVCDKLQGTKTTIFGT